MPFLENRQGRSQSLRRSVGLTSGSGVTDIGVALSDIADRSQQLRDVVPGTSATGLSASADPLDQLRRTGSVTVETGVRDIADPFGLHRRLVSAIAPSAPTDSGECLE